MKSFKNLYYSGPIWRFVNLVLWYFDFPADIKIYCIVYIVMFFSNHLQQHLNPKSIKWHAVSFISNTVVSTVPLWKMSYHLYIFSNIHFRLKLTANLMMLLVYTVLQTWISFAPIANYAATYLNTTDANINWLSTVYMVTTPFGFIAVWILDTYGLAPVVSSRIYFKQDS